MCKFVAHELELLWQLLETFIKQNYNVGRGKKCQVSEKDMLFVLLAVLKRGDDWDVLGRVFKIKGRKFERMMSKFVSIISDHVYKFFCQNIVGLRHVTATRYPS